MAIRVTCDGCNEPIRSGATHHTLGLVRKLEYCDACAWDVLRYVKARNELHTAIAEDWKHRVKALAEDFTSKHPDGRLPD